MKQPGPDPAGTAFWRFHQPANVVLLCCNCHALLDDPKVPEVDYRLVAFLRDRAMATPHFGITLRNFVCHEMGTVKRRPVSVSGLAPLFDWLQTAAQRNTLPPPHRFTAPSGEGFWRIDLAAADFSYEDEADPSLPLWNGTDFLSPPTPGALA